MEMLAEFEQVIALDSRERFVDGYSGCVLCFFFSSRRRHTRCSRVWSSDVCSSDLKAILTELASRWPAPRTTSQPSRQRGPYVESTKPKSHTPLSEPGTRLPEAPSSLPRMRREYSRARAPALTPFRSLP